MTSPETLPAGAAPRPAGPEAEGPSRSRPAWVVVAVTLALAAVWPLTWAVSNGHTDALLGAGVEGPSRERIEQDIPDLAHLEGIGHDGQQFYVVARHPFDPAAAGDAVDTAAYRYRRILFPLLARGLSPTGGRATIAAFFALSMAGVALGALALRSLGGPRWLPLTAALSPAAVTSLNLSLSDALGAGLALAAVAAATRRRFALAVALATSAALTRETFLLVAVALAFTPGTSRRWRAAAVAVPAAAVAAWTAFLALRLDSPATEDGAAQLAVPFTGWLSGHTNAASFVMGLLAAGLLALGAWRCRARAPHVAVALVAQLVLLVCLSELVAFNWVNAVRTAAPLLPLAVWAVVDRREPSAPAGDVAPAPA